MLKQNEIEDLLREIKRAGSAALDINRREFRVDTKADDSPVTEADHMVSELLVKFISEKFPDDVVISEEVSEATTQVSDRVWYIDPIDGTKDFIQKNGEWSIIVGLAEKGRPVFGVVYQPQADTLYYAKAGSGAYRRRGEEHKMMKVRKFESLEKCVMVTSRNHPSPRTTAMTDRLGIREKYIHGSVGIKIGHVAEGRADVYVNLAGKANTWDFCGPDVILSEAGGVLVTLGGRPLEYSPTQARIESPVIASTRDFADAVLPLLLN